MASSQKYDSVVLSGGGSKGFAQLGNLLRYYESGLFDLEHVKVYAGTSIGSMLALLMVCGYTPMEIFKEIYSIQSLFNVNHNLGVWDIFSNFGLTSIDTFASHIEKMVARKFGGNIPTMEELYVKTGKLLIIIATNVSDMAKSKTVFTYKTAPTLACTEPMKMSCNLPLLFTRIKYKGSYYVDGGLVCNVPLCEIPEECERTLCIVTMGTNLATDELNFLGYFCRLVILPINQITRLDCQYTRKKGRVDMIVMTFDNIPILDVTMKDAQKMKLFVQGYERANLELTKEYLSAPEWRSSTSSDSLSANDEHREPSKDGWSHENEWNTEYEEVIV